jgi:biopolymer transport protein ExbD
VLWCVEYFILHGKEKIKPMKLTRRQKVPEIEAGSMSSIAFLLMLFFIVLCSVNADTGIARRLPPVVTKVNHPVVIAPRNLLNVYITSNNELYCNHQLIGFGELRDHVKLFIQNPENDPSLPEKTEIIIPYFGSELVTVRHIISVQCERGTKYQAYVDVQNELNAAYNELRKSLARRKWGKDFSELTEKQQIAVCQYYPIRISEAEPIREGGDK